MMLRRESAVFLIFVVLVAPLAAAVLIAALLLFGAAPQLVFAPGHAVKAALQSVGVRAPNAVGVLSTVATWWLALVLAAVAWDRRRRHGAT